MPQTNMTPKEIVLKIQSNLVGAAELARAVLKNPEELLNMLSSAEEVLVASHMILTAETAEALPTCDYVDNGGDQERLERARYCFQKSAENFGKLTEEQLGQFGFDGWESLLMATDEVLRSIQAFV